MKTKVGPEKRKRKKELRFGLCVRMTLLVSAELVGCVLLTLAVHTLFSKVFFKSWKVPLFIELPVISLILGILVTSILSRRFLDPVKKLGEAMKKVTEGDFTIGLETKSSAKEIREIYSDFNLMTQELRATEILQTDFVSNVSHEFKTPINAIEGYSMLLQGGDNLNEEQKQYVDKILFNTNRLSSLVGSILLLSKIENQSIPTNQVYYRLDEQIRQSIVALEPAWEKKEIEFDIEMDSISYMGNENMMRHVWDNLIGNAIKFDPSCGLIGIRLMQQGENILFTIEDNGPGISEEAQKHIFDKFYQADSSHKGEGNGLGLALVKKILSVSGGEIFVENLMKGGCRFTVLLKTKSDRESGACFYE